MSKLDLVLDRLAIVRRNGRQTMCLCPAHSDSNASLSVSENEDKILLHCFGGCAPDKVLESIGLTWRDISTGLISAKRPGSFVIREKGKTVSAEIPPLAERYRQAMTPDRYACLTEALSVSVTSLMRLGVGWDGMAHTFPMSDFDGRIIGIRRRFPHGYKCCVPGSRNGLFIPSGLSGTSPLLIVEGNSDCAAGLDLDFDVIGRPSCSAGVDLIRKYIRQHPYDQIIVVKDNDTPGIKGGEKLAHELRLYCRDIRQVIPPKEYIDLRCWCWAGLTREQLLNMI